MVEIFIIGIPDSYRGGGLERDLTELGLRFQRVTGVTKAYRDQPAETFVDQEAAQRVYGRNLTSGEVGCALAHHSIYADQSIRTDWAIVLEDDATLPAPAEFGKLLRYLPDFRFEDPTILMLFARQALTKSGSIVEIGGHTFREARIIPSGAVAYACNAPARVLLESESLPLISPADWPFRTANKLEFLLPSELLVDIESDVDSAVGSRSKIPVSRQVIKLVSHLSGREWIRSREYWPDFRTYLARFKTWVGARMLLLFGAFETERLPKVPHGIIDLLRTSRKLKGRE